MAKKCSNCGSTSLNENAKFCMKCGKDLIDEKSCPNCGKLLKDINSSFCSFCGNKLTFEKLPDTSPLMKGREKLTGDIPSIQNKGSYIPDEKGISSGPEKPVLTKKTDPPNTPPLYPDGHKEGISKPVAPTPPSNKKDVPKSNPKIVVVAFIVIILALVVLLNVAKTQVPYTAQECKNVQVPYTGQDCADVQVPYTAQECADVQVPYAGQSCSTKNYAYNVKYTTCTQYDRGIFTPSPAQVTCTVNNLENQGGTFSITYGFIIGGVQVASTGSVYIYASSSGSRSYSYNGQIDQCYCVATPPTYQDCQTVTQYQTQNQCHDVTKYQTQNQCHDVTKYRTDTQCSNVINYRTVSVWQSMFGGGS